MLGSVRDFRKVITKQTKHIKLRWNCKVLIHFHQLCRNVQNIHLHVGDRERFSCGKLLRGLMPRANHTATRICQFSVAVVLIGSSIAEKSLQARDSPVAGGVLKCWHQKIVDHRVSFSQKRPKARDVIERDWKLRLPCENHSLEIGVNSANTAAVGITTGSISDTNSSFSKCPLDDIVLKGTAPIGAVVKPTTPEGISCAQT